MERALIPLHPPRTSIPMTCAGSNGQHDLVFHMLYIPSTQLLYALVETMAHRLAVITSTDYILSVLPCIHPASGAGLDMLLTAWILMMNVDMQMKQLIVNPLLLANRKSFGINDATQCAHLSNMKMIDKEKAKRFLTDLSNITIPRWMQNELRTNSDLVRSVKALYLNS